MISKRLHKKLAKKAQRKELKRAHQARLHEERLRRPPRHFRSPQFQRGQQPHSSARNIAESRTFGIRMLPPGFADIETYYTALCAFLSDPFITWLVNVHVNDSYTEDLVGNTPPEWATLSSWDAIVDIALLRDNSSYPPSLVQFIDNCRWLMIVREPCREETPLEHYDDFLLQGMKVKKIHEVEA